LGHAQQADTQALIRTLKKQIAGGHTTGKRVLAAPQPSTTNDSAGSVRTTAGAAAEKYTNKLRYFL